MNIPRVPPHRGWHLLRIAVTLLAIPVAASNGAERTTQDEYQEVQTRLREEEARIQKLLEREGSILDAIESAGRRVDEERKALVAVTARLATIQAERDTTIAGLATLEEKTGEARVLLRKRLRSIYRQLQEGNLAVLVSTEDYDGLIQRAKYLTYFADRDRRLIEDYRSFRRLLDDQRRELAEIEQRLTDTAERRRAQERRYKEEQKKKKLLLAQVRGKKAHFQKMVEELKVASSELRELLKREDEARRKALLEGDAVGGQPGKPFAKMKGGLRWPVKGRVVARYGSQRDPEFNTPVFRNGVEIATRKDTTVEAVLAGRVVYADRFKGFGNLVILDHGEGYHTLYAHLSESAVLRGENVRRGQVMGIVGESGTGGAMSLYFEIRHRGRPVDPIPWLAQRK